MLNNEIKIFVGEGWSDYELLDTGEGEKLERFGTYTFVRPYEDAVWARTLDKGVWENADGRFITSKENAGGKGSWKMKNKNLPKEWVLGWRDVKFKASPTPFRHLSFFPEQASHWEFIYNKIQSANVGHPQGQSADVRHSRVKFLNLFGYTGVASLVALSAGAAVTHVDASKTSIDLAKENQKLSGMEDKPMRVIVDDALKFLEREVKRGNKYDAVIMDPPKFGRGPKGEVWKIEEKLPKLLELVAQVLSPEPLFVILTSYATDSSSLSLCYALSDALKSSAKDGLSQVEAGEMCIRETSSGKLIPLANTAVWC